MIFLFLFVFGVSMIIIIIIIKILFKHYVSLTLQLIQSTIQEAVKVKNKKLKLRFLTMYHPFLRNINFDILSRAKHLPPKMF